MLRFATAERLARLLEATEEEIRRDWTTYEVLDVISYYSQWVNKMWEYQSEDAIAINLAALSFLYWAYEVAA